MMHLCLHLVTHISPETVSTPLQREATLKTINTHSMIKYYHTFSAVLIDKQKLAETYQEMWRGVSCSSPTSSSSDEESNSVVLMASDLGEETEKGGR